MGSPPDAASKPWQMVVLDTAQEAEQHEAVVTRACRKLNKLMLPFALLFSIIASLDRANLSFASVSMSEELGFSPVDYGLGSAIFFVSYSLFQVPSNICFIYLGGPLVLGLIAVSWGIIAGSMAAVSTRSGFLTVRFLLGIAEAGTVPGIWAYLSSMYPSSHLTLPTTFYMAGITAAQALGAPLAAGLLSLDGAAGMAGWRWLFVIEGTPAVLLGFAIWVLLPSKVSNCKLLTPEEQQHLQAAIDCTMPPSTADVEPIHTSMTSGKGMYHQPSSPSSSVTPKSGSMSRENEPWDQSPKAKAAAATAGSSEQALAAGLRHTSKDGRPSKQQLVADMLAAARCKVVWCSSCWRFLYVLTLNGLIFWVPLLVQSMLEGSLPQAHGSSSAHPHLARRLTSAATLGSSSRNDSQTMLLAAVPYVAGVVTHVINALHSHHVDERRYHIAVPWLIGGVIMLVLPVAWMHQAHTVSYVLLILASMGVMGCDGIDVSWIIGLMHTLSPSQSVLALAMVNMLANFGGFVGNYVIGALKQGSGNYYGAMWMMGSVMILAAAMVAAFPLAWAGGQCGCKQAKRANNNSIEAALELPKTDQNSKKCNCDSAPAGSDVESGADPSAA